MSLHVKVIGAPDWYLKAREELENLLDRDEVTKKEYYLRREALKRDWLTPGWRNGGEK